MALETELKLRLTRRAAARLAAQPVLAGVVPTRQKLRNTYFDTADLQLRRQHIALRYRQQGRLWLLTVKCADPSAGALSQRPEWEAPGVPGAFDFSHVDDARLRRQLNALRSQLCPVFQTNFTRQAWLLTPQPGVCIELALDRGRLEANTRQEPICELELELLQGSAADLFALASTLQASLPLHPLPASKAERGYRLHAGEPLQPVHAGPVALARHTDSLAAWHQITLACVAQLQGNEAGITTANADHAEYVHQARVAIRRLRCALRVWGALLPDDFVARFDPQWQALGAQLGQARDGEVFVSSTLPALARAPLPDSSADLARLARYALGATGQHQQRARAAVRGAPYSTLLLDFTAATLALPATAAPTLKRFARKALDKRLRQVRQLAAQQPCNASSADGAHQHRLRIALKRLRYAIEFFLPLLKPHAVHPYLRSVADLTDRLGTANDLLVARRWVSLGLSAHRAQPIAHWLQARAQHLGQQAGPVLRAFLQQKPPW